MREKIKRGIIGKYIGMFIGIMLSPLVICLGFYYCIMFDITKNDRYSADHFVTKIINVFTTWES